MRESAWKLRAFWWPNVELTAGPGVAPKSLRVQRRYWVLDRESFQAKHHIAGPADVVSVDLLG